MYAVDTQTALQDSRRCAQTQGVIDGWCCICNLWISCRLELVDKVPYLWSLAPSMKSNGARTLSTWAIGDTSRNLAS